MSKKYGLFDKILLKIKDKKVLDVGCVGEFHDKGESELWIHGFLAEHAKELVGIDIKEEDIAKLKEKGFRVYQQNAEEFDLDERFNVIFAGELIEHLGNPLSFLQKCRNHLKKDGVLILSTPNTFNPYENLFNVLLFRNDPPVNPEHTCYYSPTTIKELLRREGFDSRVDYFDFYGTLLGKLRYKVLEFLPERFKRRMLIVCQNNANQD